MFVCISGRDGQLFYEWVCVCVCYYYTFRQHTHLESLFFQFYFYFFMYETYFLVHINVKDFFGFVLFLYTFIYIRVRTEFACFVMWGFVYNNFFVSSFFVYYCYLCVYLFEFRKKYLSQVYSGEFLFDVIMTGTWPWVLTLSFLSCTLCDVNKETFEY